jgi:hypothetical protein
MIVKKRTPYSKKYPERSKDVFVTQEMLFAVRDELKGDIKASTLGLRSEFQEVKSDIAKMSAQIYELRALTEEQNARNIPVLDALTSLFTRQDRVEGRVDEVEKTIATFRRR